MTVSFEYVILYLTQTGKGSVMAGYYDDNFGCWEGMEDEEMVDFYFQVQRTNVEKVCRCCGRTVMLRPEYDLCGSCADMGEY